MLVIHDARPSWNSLLPRFSRRGRTNFSSASCVYIVDAARGPAEERYVSLARERPNDNRPLYPTFSSAINKNSLDNVFESSYVYFKVPRRSVPFRSGQHAAARTQRVGLEVVVYLRFSLSLSLSLSLFLLLPDCITAKGKMYAQIYFDSRGSPLYAGSPATLDMNFRAASLCTCIPTIGRPYSPPCSRGQWCSLSPYVLTLNTQISRA